MQNFETTSSERAFSALMASSNLLKNTHATEDIAYWERSTEEHPSVENSARGAHKVMDYASAEEIKGKKVKNWVTSHYMATMTQHVPLLDNGCTAGELDTLKLPIYVSAWCASRWDCGAVFHLTVRLLDARGQQLDSFHKEVLMDSKDSREMWHKVEHTFKDYASGVRVVQFTMGGKDTQYWAGDFGSKFALPCVRVVL